ncbi:hypothetical protein LTR36_003776 [Oleoguttula mirabilis]|uniref:Uncharacterized protein n=1 Tax=Oleoguttula mirabilis TaxID=1507867 RepID=A0AAV9JIR9_9PEZI|nr:hypothetical protein LTR36_003776 [Oleoguttula mirabilis]
MIMNSNNSKTYDNGQDVTDHSRPHNYLALLGTHTLPTTMAAPTPGPDHSNYIFAPQPRIGDDVYAAMHDRFERGELGQFSGNVSGEESMETTQEDTGHVNQANNAEAGNLVNLYEPSNTQAVRSTEEILDEIRQSMLQEAMGYGFGSQ